LILFLFFLSGACTLVYQIVWVRMLVLVFGTSVFAVSTVLTVFMAGLALGSASFGRLVDRKGNGLRIYAYLEAGIGAFAIAFPFILAGLDDLYTFFYRLLEGSTYAFSLVRFLISFAVLLVPTTLMGATLPVLSKFFVRHLTRVGRGVGGLYAVNTFGAVAGCILAAFLLMEHVGIKGTIYITAGANLLIAVVAFLLSPASDGAGAPVPAAKREERSPLSSPLLSYLVFWGFALSGFAALGYEVVWTRLLSVVLRLTTTQSLSIILIAFLFGLAAGGAVGARLADRWKALLAVFALIELLLGLFGMASIAVFGGVPQLQQALGGLPSWWGHAVKLLVISFGIMLVPTFLMGLLFPIVGRLRTPDLGSLGKRIGDIYAVNTAGAIFGAFAAGFILIPFLGTQVSIQLLASINIALGLVVLLMNPAVRPRPKAGILTAMALPVLLLAILLPPDHMKAIFQRSQPRSSLLFCNEQAGGTVAVYQFPNGDRVLRVNGAGEVPTDHASIQTFRLLGNLPLLLHPAPQEVLVIAFGGGITLASVEKHRPGRIDCVEVVPGVFEAARFFARYNDRVHERLDSGDINIIVDDGRNHVLRTEQLYDVIISDSTHPATADSWVLYTEEFYRLCRERLSTGGYFAQWLPLHGLGVDDYKMILRTFQRVFPHASLWLTTDYSILLGTPEELLIDVARMKEGLRRTEVEAALREVDLDDPVSFLSTLALGETAISEYAGSGPVNTDDRPYISFTRGGRPAMLSLIPHLGGRLRARLTNVGEEETRSLERRLKARQHTLIGDLALKMGARQRALEHLRQALAIDPEERGASRAMRRLQRGSAPGISPASP
jgi:spermidine synthase